jgi:hypothetical protein
MAGRRVEPAPAPGLGRDREEQGAYLAEPTGIAITDRRAAELAEAILSEPPPQPSDRPPFLTTDEEIRRGNVPRHHGAFRDGHGDPRRGD